MVDPKAVDLKCPECGAAMKLRSTSKFRTPAGRDRVFYGCGRFPACKATHGAHPDGRPMGVPGDKNTKAARKRAHDALDIIIRKFGLSRTEGYRVLCGVMGLTKDVGHIAMFDARQCDELIRRLAALTHERVQDLTK